MVSHIKVLKRHPATGSRCSTFHPHTVSQRHRSARFLNEGEKKPQTSNMQRHPGGPGAGSAGERRSNKAHAEQTASSFSGMFSRGGTDEERLEAAGHNYRPQAV
ncbi:uncharacterized [Tachysurus ichikawai]